MSKQNRRLGLFASGSIAAILMAAGTPPALALFDGGGIFNLGGNAPPPPPPSGCDFTQNGGTVAGVANPAGSTIPCLKVENGAQVTGTVSNKGTLSRSGIVIDNSFITGSIFA